MGVPLAILADPSAGNPAQKHSVRVVYYTFQATNRVRSVCCCWVYFTGQHTGTLFGLQRASRKDRTETLKPLEVRTRILQVVSQFLLVRTMQALF